MSRIKGTIMKKRTLLLTTLTLLMLAACANPFGARKANPFGVTDPPGSPDDSAVQAFAARFNLPGDERDPNAAAWPPRITEGRADSLEGEWFSRWGGPAEPTTCQESGGRLYFLTRDTTAKPAWLLVAVREGNRLRGRWVNATNRNDNGIFTGTVVGHDRIDGVWTSDGARWDFRRRLQ